MAERKAAKKFTEAEKEGYKNHSKNLKEMWGGLTEQEVAARTKPGLDALNKKIKCKYCDVMTTPGNIKRWHDENCKRKKDFEDQ